MKLNPIQQDVDRGLQLRQIMAECEQELKAIEARLRLVALNGPQIDLIDVEREGRQFIAEGSLVKVPIVITADQVIGSFADGSKHHLNIQTAAQGLFPQFYRRKVSYELAAKDGKAFRKQAHELLGAQAPVFIDKCLARDKDGIPKNAVKVEWDRAEAPTSIAA